MNKKIRNVTPLEYDGIKFKSTLEKNTYKIFKESGFDIAYEPFTYTLWRGFKPTIPFYDKNKKTHNLILNNKKIIDIKYTPDFVVIYPPNIMAFVEAKGMENDVFYIKKKLFRSFLERQYAEGYTQFYPMYFEIYSVRHIAQAIDIIKQYAEEVNRNQSSDN